MRFNKTAYKIVPCIAFIFDVTDEVTSRKLLGAEFANCWKLGHRFFHSKISHAVGLVDVTSATRTSRSLILQASISEQVRKAARAHQMSIATL